MTAIAAVLIPLPEVLTDLGLSDDQVDDAIELIDNYFEASEDSPDGSPEVCEGFGVYVEDEELLKAAATILRCLKGFEVKPEPEKINEKPKADTTRKSAPKAKDAEGYFTCARSGQRIHEKVCLGRREQKKHGCRSCKVGREIENKL